MWTFWPQKVDFLNLTPLNPPTKTSFLAHFVTKSEPFGRFGVVHRTPPGYGPEDDIQLQLFMSTDLWKYGNK